MILTMALKWLIVLVAVAVIMVVASLYLVYDGLVLLAERERKLWTS